VPHLVIARFACDTAWHELMGGGEAMANAMLDARQEGDSYRRVEVITGERRRRRWTSEEKARIAAESFEEGANISEVARRNGVSRGLLTVWRRQVAAAVAGKAQNFVPIQIGAESDGGRAGAGASECISPVQMKPLEIAAPQAKVCGVVEIEMKGARIRVEPGVDSATLSVVLSALRGIR
jgi:transposase